MKKTQSKITSWGNSFGLRLPKDFVAALSYETESPVEIYQTAKDTFEVRKISNDAIISKETFIKAFKNKKIEVEPYDWGKPQGKELW